MKSTPYVEITMPNPCNEDWNKMPVQGDGRYCDECRKCVVDFTGFTDLQLYDYFVSREGQDICGRFKVSQMGRKITLPYQPQSRLYMWAIAAGLVLLTVAAPETNSFARTPFSVCETVMMPDIVTVGGNDTLHVKGILLDDKNEPVQGVNVTLFDAHRQVAAQQTGEDGAFSFIITATGEYVLSTSANGYYHEPVYLSNTYIKDTIRLKMITATRSADDVPVMSGPPPMPVRRR